MGCPLESYITLPIFYSTYIIFVCCCLKKWKAFKNYFMLDSTARTGFHESAGNDFC